jgi:signal-transduction protein with cAMP-binding, CBS, and nucleotidyltransferase domain
MSTTVTLADRIFLLRGLPAFSRLYDSEVGSIAAVCRVRTYEPGETISRPGQPLRHLYLVASGRVLDERAGPLPAVFGATSLLTGQPLDTALTADPEEGATCFLLGRAHFFTLVHEYPPLLVNLLNEWRGGWAGS